MKNKKAAMEMSVGTIVTIVLLMSVLVLGLILIRTIFKSAVENIEGMGKAVNEEVNKLFAQDKDKKVVVFPSTRKVSVKKGEETDGFAFSIRNLNQEETEFDYKVIAKEISCDADLSEAEDMVFPSIGTKLVGAGEIMQDAEIITFNVPEGFPPCKIVYDLEISDGGGVYGSPTQIIVSIQAK